MRLTKDYESRTISENEDYKKILDMISFYATDEQFQKIKSLYDSKNLNELVNMDFSCPIPFRFTREQAISIMNSHYFNKDTNGLYRLFSFIQSGCVAGKNITLDDYKKIILNRVKKEVDNNLKPLYDSIKKEAEENGGNFKQFNGSNNLSDEDERIFMDLRLFERIFDSLVSSISWIKNQEDGEKIIEEFFIPFFEREEVSYVYNRKYTAKVKFLTNGKYHCTCWFHRIEESFYWSDDFIKRNLDLFSVDFITKNKLYLKPNFKKLLDDTIKMRIKDSISSTISEYYPDYLKCFEVDIKFDSETFYLLNEIRDSLSEKEEYPLEEVAEERKYSEEDDPDLNLYYYYCNIGNETSGFIE